MRPQHSKHAAPGRHTRANARGRVLYHHALARRKSEQFRPAPVWLRIRLAPLHHVPRDNALRHRQSSRRQPPNQKPPCRRSHNRPSLRRKPCKQRLRPRQNRQIGRVINLHILDHTQPFGHLGLVELRLQHPHNVHRARAVRHFEALRIRHAIHFAPPVPAPHHRPDRTDQHAIHIEQQPLRLDRDRIHRCLFRQVRLSLHRTPHAARPASTKVLAASKICPTDSADPLSLYTRSSGSVPEARSKSQVTAALIVPAHTGFSRKNLMPSIVSTRSTFIPA